MLSQLLIYKQELLSNIKERNCNAVSKETPAAPFPSSLLISTDKRAHLALDLTIITNSPNTLEVIVHCTRCQHGCRSRVQHDLNTAAIG